MLADWAMSIGIGLLMVAAFVVIVIGIVEIVKPIWRWLR